MSEITKQDVLECQEQTKQILLCLLEGWHLPTDVTDQVCQIVIDNMKKMKTITLQEAVAILEKSSAVVIDDNGLCYASVYGIEGRYDNVFLHLSYDDEGNTIQYDFTEGDNKEITVIGSSMFLKDAEHGEECQLTILCPQNLET